MRFVPAAELRERLPMKALVSALRWSFARGMVVPPRQGLALPGGGSSLLMPAWREGGAYGVKVVNVCPANREAGLPAVQALYTLFDATTGVPRLLLDGAELTTRRTAAASALAAGFLAMPEPTLHLIVGAGQVASLLPEAMRVVRPTLARWLVWNHRVEGAEKLVAQLRERGFAAEVATELPLAVASAHIVSCATLAEQPLVQGEWLAPGAHLDLIGSFTPAMREADDDAFRGAALYVDTPEALVKSGELLEPMSRGVLAAADVRGTLESLCRGQAPGRSSATQRTVFKSVGSALEDLCAAQLTASA